MYTHIYIYTCVVINVYKYTSVLFWFLKFQDAVVLVNSDNFECFIGKTS